MPNENPVLFVLYPLVVIRSISIASTLPNNDLSELLKLGFSILSDPLKDSELMVAFASTARPFPK